MYFTSDKSGDWQIWNYDFQVKSKAQVTQKSDYQVKTDSKQGFTELKLQGLR